MEIGLMVEIGKERKEREGTEENILKMIEHTCNRIDSASLFRE
jgi:hypothetical protein